MTIIDRILKFEKEYYYLEKDKYQSVFSAADIIMEYYTQKGSISIHSLDDVVDGFYALYAYDKIHDSKSDQDFCSDEDLVEYNSVLHRYFNGKTRDDINEMIDTWMLIELSRPAHDLKS